MNFAVTNIAYWALLIVAIQSASAQDRIAGQLNFHAAVVDIDTCRNLVVVDRGLGPAFREGDRVLLHQAFGVVIDTTFPDDDQVIDIGEAGKHQFTAVASVRGDTVFLSDDVSRFSFTDGLQCVRVIQAKSAIVQPTATVVPWNGRSGGIAVIECTDTLTLDGFLTASGCGFRGGNVSVNAAFDNVASGFVDEQSGRSASKGESAARRLRGSTGGNASWANGGGGGNGRNSGGGGGALAAEGGRGGDQTSEVGRVTNGGRGGRAIVDQQTETKLHFGAGGGGGHQNDNLGSSGGRGGGIIILRAPTLVVTSRGGLESDGRDADTAVQDGAGGGGAGGTIILDVDTVIGSLTPKARGGQGGNILSEFACYGPGGGGSGGIVAAPSSARLDVRSLAPEVSGGTFGRSIVPPRDCPNDTRYGATSGADGYVGAMPALVDYRITRPAPQVQPADTIVCAGQPVAIAVTGGVLVTVQPASLVETQFASGVRSVPLFTDTTLLLTITSGRSGCFQQRLVRIRTQQPDISRMTVVRDTVICLGQRSRLSLQGISNLISDISSMRGNRIAEISDTTFEVEAVVVGQDELRIRIMDSSGCSALVTTGLFVADTTPSPPEQVVVLCKDSIELDAGPGYVSYRWSTGDTTRRVLVSSSGQYDVDVAAPLSCSARAVFRVLPFTSSIVTISAPRTILVGDSDTVVVAVRGARGSITWNNGTSGETLLVTEEGAVWATVTTPEGCQLNSDTVMITRQSLAARLRLSTIDTIRYKPGDRGILPLMLRHDVPASRDVTIECAVQVSLGSLLPDQQRRIDVDGTALIIEQSTTTDGLSGVAEVRVNVLVPKDQQVTTILVPYVGILGTDSISVISISSCAPAASDVTCERDADGLVINEALCRDGGLRRFDPGRTAQRLKLVQRGVVEVVGPNEISNMECYDLLGRGTRLLYQPERQRAERLERAPGLYWWVVRLAGGQILLLQELSPPL